MSTDRKDPKPLPTNWKVFVGAKSGDIEKKLVDLELRHLEIFSTVYVDDILTKKGHVIKNFEIICAEANKEIANAEEIIRQALNGDVGQQNVAAPPRAAEFFLSLMLPEKCCDAAIGDLSERFENDCRRFGVGRARRIYWGRAIRSVWPLLRRAAARVVRWGMVVETVRRFF